MPLMDYFKPVPTMSVSEVKQVLDIHEPASYLLIDVRTRAEYEKEHLPGALHLPQDVLPEKAKEIDCSGPVITY